MIANVENTVKWLRTIGAESFDVTTSETNQNRYIFKYDGNKTFDTNIEDFSQIMEINPGVRFFIIAKKGSGANGQFRNEFANLAPGSNGTAAIGAVHQAAPVSEDEITRRVQAELDKRELAELREENRYLERELNKRESIGEQFMQRLPEAMNMIKGIFAMKQGSAVSIQGIAAAEPLEATEIPNNDVNTRIMAALQKWAAADDDFLTLLEKIAEMAASGNSMYQMAKNMM